MPDWTKSMKQTFEYYTVDPGTWKDDEELTKVVSCTITRDATTSTLASATMEMTESIGEKYVRVYLVTEQATERSDGTVDNVVEKHALGTFMVQTPGTNFNGKVHTYNMDAYSPLMELKEKKPPIGYSLRKKTDIMPMAFKLVRELCRAPVVYSQDSTELFYDFVANTDDSWLSFLTDFLANAEFIFDLDMQGRILFAPVQDTASLQPVRTYDDSNSSILYPEVNINRDLYGIPNVVEVSYSDGDGFYYAKVVNSNKNSPTSTVNRGREIIYREVNPRLSGEPSQKQIERYAKQLLREKSTLEYTVSYTHGYCPSRPGDAVILNYERAGIKNVKAKIISQTIKCIPGCPVSEKAVYTSKLWG